MCASCFTSSSRSQGRLLEPHVELLHAVLNTEGAQAAVQMQIEDEAALHDDPVEAIEVAGRPRHEEDWDQDEAERGLPVQGRG